MAELANGDSEYTGIVLEEGTSRKDPEKDFQLLEKLGEGSYGAVWKALHKQTGIIVAIKRVGIDNDLEDIMKEIDFMKGCRSPFIVRYFGSYFKDNELWIVMEYCGAGSVCDMMKICDSILSEEQIAVVCKDVLQGLNYLHGLRKIHRDIKAGNILLNINGSSKLADFGVSGQLSDTMAKRQTVIGTPFWMAPEVIQEVGYDFKADIWSLGITCIEMAESKPPYSNIHPMRAIFMIPSRPPPKLTEPDKWSKEFNDFLFKALTKSPDQRPTATELLEHPFIKNAKTRVLLQPLLDQQDQIINRIGRDAALGIEPDDDDDDDNDNDDDAGGTVKRNDVKRRPRAGSNESDGGDDMCGTVVITDTDSTGYGTTIITSDELDDDDNTGTIKSTKSKGSGSYVPPFLDHIKKSLREEKPPPITPGNPKYANLSLEQLKKMVEDIDIQKEKEIMAIKEKYATNKRSLMAAIEERNKQK
jgi:serine/threonine protein kinase